MKRILVVQLCRMGDILMTGPLLRGLRREHPHAEISLMVMDAFAGTPLPSHLYDRLLPFPLQSLAGVLAAKGASWESALKELNSFVQGSAASPFDIAINLTHTDMSAWLMAAIPARKRVGLVMRSDRSKAIDSGWMTYLRASMRSRDVSCFHVVDLFAWTAGVGRDAAGLEIDITAADHDWAEQFIQQNNPTRRPMIAMQLGASTAAKQWPVQRFAALADALDPALGEIVLVGGANERPLASEFKRAAARSIIDTDGSSSLRQLAALLQRCRLLITNDTGPMHIAAAVCTRVMDISSGPVTAIETGPYGDGHIVVEPEIACYPCPLDSDCSHFACRESLSPADAAAAARFAMDEGPAPAISGARLLRTRRSPRSGRIEFVPVGAMTLKDRVRLEAADVWEQTLSVPARVGDGWASGEWVNEPMLEAKLPMFDAPQAHAMLKEIAREAASAADTVRRLPKAAPAKVTSIAAGVHETLERLLAMGESERAAHAIVTHLRYEIDSVHAADLPSMARGQAAAYAAASTRARLLAERLSA